MRRTVEPPTGRVRRAFFAFLLISSLLAFESPAARADPPRRDFDAACDQSFSDGQRRAECKRYCRHGCPEILARGVDDPGRQCLRLRLKGSYPCDDICGNGAVEPARGEECDPPESTRDCDEGQTCGSDCRCLQPTDTPTATATDTATPTATSTLPPTDPCTGRDPCMGTCTLGALLGACVSELGLSCSCCPVQQICNTPFGATCCDEDEFCGLTSCEPCRGFGENCTEDAQCCSRDCFSGACD